MHQIRLTRHADQRVGRYLTGFNDPEAMALIESTGTGVGRIVDQAQASHTLFAATLPGMLQESAAQPTIAPTLMQGQA